MIGFLYQLLISIILPVLHHIRTRLSYLITGILLQALLDFIASSPRLSRYWEPIRWTVGCWLYYGSGALKEMCRDYYHHTRHCLSRALDVLVSSRLGLWLSNRCHFPTLPSTSRKRSLSSSDDDTISTAEMTMTPLSCTSSISSKGGVFFPLSPRGGGDRLRSCSFSSVTRRVHFNSIVYMVPESKTILPPISETKGRKKKRGLMNKMMKRLLSRK